MQRDGRPPQEEPDADGRAPRERLWSGTFVLLVGVSLCAFLTGQGLNAGTSVYVEYYGHTAAYAGMLATAFSVASGLTRLLIGPAIDARGRRAVMLVGGILLTAGTAAPLLAHQAAALTLFRLVQGIGFAALSTAAATAAADVLPTSRLGEGIGYFGLGQALAMSVGPALALALVATLPHENLYAGFALAAAAGLVCAVLSRYEAHPETLPASSEYRRLHERRMRERAASAEAADGGTAAAPAGPRQHAQGTQGQRGLWRLLEKRALPGTAPLFLLTPAFGFAIYFIGLYGTHLGLDNAGVFFTVSAITMVIVRLRSSALIDRLAPFRLFAVAAAAGVLAYGMLLLAGTALAGGSACAPVFLAAGVPYGICIGLALPTGQAVAVRNSPPERWGAATAMYQLAPDIGCGVSAAVWGIVSDVAGFPATLCCVMACICASLALAGTLWPHEPMAEDGAAS